MSPDREACLLDTNVLIRFADAADPLHEAARRAVASNRRTYDLKVTAQNLIETWNVMTRPRERNGFGQSVAQAETHLALLERLFHRLIDPPNVYDTWRDLVVRFEVSGVQVHDAKIVAIMLGCDVSKILTFDVRDFARYSAVGVEALDPRGF